MLDPMKLPRTLLLSPLLLLLFLSGCYSLAEDVTPPPGYEYQLPPPTEDTMYYPLVPPDPEAGAALYAQNCAACHGVRGLGDGPQASQLPNPVAPIGDPALARQSHPSEWFRTITEGRLDRYMPPFLSLTERQRWDVLAYVYTLSAGPDVVAQGQELYQATCAACHGVTGRGDGVEAASLATPATDFTDQRWMAERSPDDLIQGMAHPGSPDVDDFASQLTEDETWALAAYLRSLSFAQPAEEIAAEPPYPVEDTTGETGPSGEQPPEEAASPADESVTQPGSGTVTGQVVNLSGGEVPSDLAVVLHGFDQFEETLTITTTVGADGSFAFENVEMPPERAFIITVDYQRGTYTSDVAVIQEQPEDLELPVSIYEATTDTDGLVIERLHVLFEFVDPETVRVAELYIISNPSDRIVIAPEEGQPVLEFSLPEGATNLQFQDGSLGQQFVRTPDGFGDLRGIPPGQGQHQVLFSFDLPYKRKAEIIQPLALPANAVVVLAPDVGVRVKSDLLTDEGTRDIQGVVFNTYTATDLPAGSQLSITLSGRPKLARPGLAKSSTTSLAVGLSALGITIIAAGVWLYRRSNDTTNELPQTDTLEDTLAPLAEMNAEELMDAIIALDDRAAAGDIPQDAYLKRRAILKEHLRQKLDTTDH